MNLGSAEKDVISGRKRVLTCYGGSFNVLQGIVQVALRKPSQYASMIGLIHKIIYIFCLNLYQIVILMLGSILEDQFPQ